MHPPMSAKCQKRTSALQRRVCTGVVIFLTFLKGLRQQPPQSRQRPQAPKLAPLKLYQGPSQSFAFRPIRSPRRREQVMKVAQRSRGRQIDNELEFVHLRYRQISRLLALNSRASESVINSRRFIASPEAQDGAIVTVQMGPVKGRPDVRFGSKADMCSGKACPPYSRKQTCAVQLGMSALCQ